MYLDDNPVWRHLCLIHPKKVAFVEVEVEKILCASFIYLVPLIDWVSNIVLVMQKQGTIHVCVNYRDINHASYEDNYPTPFIHHIVDDCGGSEVFPFMDCFSSYNKINILPLYQHKTAFICPWGTFSYQKLPFGLKIFGETFHRGNELCLP